MAGLFYKKIEAYQKSRPTYPAALYSMLAHRTYSHSLAWDVGTGNGQVAIGLAEHYDRVIATDINEAGLKLLTKPHPRVRYLHTPESLSDNELINLIGGENAVDLVTAALTAHLFDDLPRFYSIINRVLPKPNGVVAVWGYMEFAPITPPIDAALKQFRDTTMPYWHDCMKHLLDGYRSLGFPFQSIGLGSEGSPMKVEIPIQLSLVGVLDTLRCWSAVANAKKEGVDLLSESVVEQLEKAWGGRELVRDVVYNGFMLAGKPLT